MVVKNSTGTLNGDKAVAILTKYSVGVSPQWASPIKESKQRIVIADTENGISELPPPTVYQVPVTKKRVSFCSNPDVAVNRRHDDGVQPKKHVEYFSHLHMKQNRPNTLKSAFRRSSLPMMGSTSSFLPSTTVKSMMTKPFSFERRRSSIGRSNTTSAAAASAAVVTTPWKVDKQLLQSKVYKARLDKAATLLQKYVRRWLCRFALAYAATATWQRRRHIAAKRIQMILRRWHDRRQGRRNNAATTVQCAVRGYLARLQGRVYQLQRQLLSLQDQQQQDLEQTVEYQKRELRALRRQEHSADWNRHLAIDCAMQTMYKLERENKRLKARQERWQRKCQDMLEHNQRLEETLRQTSTLTEQVQSKTVAPLEAAVDQWQTILDEFEQRPKLFHDALQRQGEMCQFEEQVHALYRQYILNMVQTIEADCTDDDLVNTILNVVSTVLLVEGR